MRASQWIAPVSFAALSALGRAACAADEESSDSVVVAATRIPTPELQVASSVTVISADDIEARQQQTLSDVLKDVPGLNLVQTGGPGGQTAVFMRGTNSNHTKVLIDGIDVSDPSSSGGTFDFGQLLTADIERVEVLRGPQSGLYGSDAIGGVINIITKAGSGPPQIAGEVQGGTFDTFNQAASVRGSTDGFHYSANIEHLHAGATPVTPLDLLLPGEKRNDDYYDNLTTSTRLGYDVTSGFDLGLVARYTGTHLRFTEDDFSTFPSFPAAQQSEGDTTGYYARATAHLVSLEGTLDQTLGVAFTRNRTSTLEPDFPESLATGQRAKVDWQGALKVAEGETLVLGAEHARDEISEPISASTIINSGCVELNSQLSQQFYSSVNARYDANDRFGNKATYRFAPAYVIAATGTKLKASVGTGFKAPTLSELFQDFPPFFFANPNLRPESSLGYEAGAEQGLRGDAVRFGATYFHNRIRNLITSDLTGTTYANIGRASVDGVESFVAYRPLDSLTLRLDYTYTDAIDDALHEELLRRPRHKGSLNAIWRSGPVSFDASVLAVGWWVDGNRDFSIPRLQAPGYTIVNLAGSYDLGRHFTLFGRIDNLFDRHYENPTGFLQPSIGVFAGVRAKL